MCNKKGGSFVDVDKQQSDISPPKKILLLCSKGGYGHVAAAKTLLKLFSGRYVIKVIYPINELKIWGVPSGESFYNYLLSNNWIRLMNFIAKKVAPKLFRARNAKMEALVDSYLAKEEPELVISLIPFINFPASEAARKKKIPYLLITTDNDLENWMQEIEKVIHPDFKMTIGKGLPRTKELLLQKKVPCKAISEIGLPIRPDFMSGKDKNELRQEFNFDLNKPVILIVMGGVGGRSAYFYARELAKFKTSIQLVVCAGRNQRLAKKLQSLNKGRKNPIYVLPFTERLSDWMTMSDLLITKPGSGTINEAIALKVPLFVDTFFPVLYWERANADLVNSYGIGCCIKKREELRTQLKRYLRNKNWRTELKSAFQKIPENTFLNDIGPVVEQAFYQ